MITSYWQHHRYGVVQTENKRKSQAGIKYNTENMSKQWRRKSVSLKICILLCFIHPQTNGCIETEKEALLKLRDNVKDPNGLLESWGGSSNCCQWTALHCDSHSGRVVSLDFRGFNLSTDKFMLSHLFALSELQYLDLSMNSFHGVEMPTNISLFTHLTYLNLSNTGFSGFLPFQLGKISKLRCLDFSDLDHLKIPCLKWLRNLTQLEYISLRGVNLSGHAMAELGESVCDLKRLQHLDVTNCSLVGQIPNSFRNLTSLTYLHMENNSLSSEIPNWVFTMNSLVSLNLRMNLLNGTLPARITASSLTHMDLSVNQLTGTISSVIGNLSLLTYLDLGVNKFYGTIPSSLSNLSSLNFLRLRDNGLQGTIPQWLSKLSSLTYLDLSVNELNGSVPYSLGQLSSLEILSIWGNQLGGTVTESLFQNLTKLQYLWLTDSGLTLNIRRDWIPSFNLSMLLLGGCNMGGSIPKWVSYQTRLEHLDLSRNSIVGSIPSWLWSKLHNLKTLNLSSNHLHGPLPSLALQHQLTVLELSKNNFEGNITDYIGTNLPPSLEFLSLSNNKFKGAIPSSISFLERLQNLDLSDNELNHALPSSLGNCTSLKVLTLHSNQLEGAIPDEVGNLQQLKSLDLRGNRFSEKFPSGLLNCKLLEIMDLSKNNFTGKLPNWIASLRNLRVAILRSNNLLGPIPSDIFHLPILQIIDLASNGFSGVIPSEITELLAMATAQNNGERYGRYFIAYEMYYQKGVNITNKGNELDYSSIPAAFTVIDLSANNLRGKIPGKIGKLKGLITLNLSHNHFSGVIPDSLGEIHSLESLDLSGNQLNGLIPDSIQGLDFLGYLNLSNNNLSGRIPQQRHFDTFGASSFLGNQNLCGVPLNKTCSSQRSLPPASQDEEDGEISLWKSRELKTGTGIGFIVAFCGIGLVLWYRVAKYWE